MDAADHNATAADANNAADEANHAVAAGQANNGGVADEDNEDIAEEHEGGVIALENENAVVVAVVDETSDVIALENENVVVVQEEAAVSGEARRAVVVEAGSSSRAVRGTDIFVLKGFPKIPIVNKSVLWDLEAPFLGSFFDKYQLANFKRAIYGCGECMDPILNVDVMRGLSKEEAHARFREQLELLQLSKNKYQEMMAAVESAANDFKNCVQLLDYYRDTQRLDRALVIHLLRMGYIDTAYNFALERDIEALFDFEPYHQADDIVKALRNKDLGPAKDWCTTNALRSNLECQIFCQEYIEYVRSNEKMVAISFAWEHSVGMWDHKKELLPVLASVAFGCNPTVLRYKKLFDEERWDFLIKLFWEQFNARHRFTHDASSLCILLESGITALKVPFCFDGEDCKKVDPLQHEYFCTFASTLPYARHSFPPKLLCHVTKQPLGEKNPPYMLPNGYAYSEQAIMGMTNGDQVTCPRTGFVCNIRDVKQLKLPGYIQTIPLAP